MKNLYLLPTDKPSRLVKNNLGLIRVTDNFTKSDLDFIQAEFVNIYITSDEEIIGGKELFLDLRDNFMFKNQVTEPMNKVLFPNCKKIILTTDQDLIKDGVQSIDDEFLEWFVKNPSCEEVEVKSERLYEHKDTYRPYPSECKNLTKTKINYYLSIIPKEEPKQETVNMKPETQKPIQLRNPNLPAFPTEFSYGDEDFTGQPIINKKKYAGVTKREYFTAKALGGFIARHGAVDFSEADADRIMLAVDMMLAKCKML